MSARDEQPATVPPPAGEDDAYNATTKVGAMPAEVMAKLRAEGLLPEEEPEPISTSPRPSSSFGPKPTPPRPPDPPSDNALKALPLLFSTAPPANEQQPPPPPPPIRTLDQQLDGFDMGFREEPAKEPSPSRQAPTPPTPAPVVPPPPVPRMRLDTPSTEISPEDVIASTAQHEQLPPSRSGAISFPDPSEMVEQAFSESGGQQQGFPPNPHPHPHPPDQPLQPHQLDRPELGETPIAFVATPNDSMGLQPSHHLGHLDPGHNAANVVSSSLGAQPQQPEDPALRRELRAFGGGSRLTKPQQLALLVVGILVLVALLFAMALLSQRR